MRRSFPLVFGIVGTCIWPFSCSFVPVQVHLSPSISPSNRHFLYGRISLSLAVEEPPSVETNDDDYFENTEIVGWQREAELQTNALLHLGDEGTWDVEKFKSVWEVMQAWAERPSRKSAVNLERLLRRVVEEKLAGNAHVESIDMLAMYNAVVHTWAKSREKGAPQRVEEIFDTMLHLYEAGEIDLKPDVGIFNGLLLAYSSSRGKDSPRQAIRIMQKLHDLRSSGRTDILPDTESYSIILRAFAASEGPNAPALVLKMIRRMEKFAAEGYPAVKPDFKCHNVYLNALLSTMTREDGNRAQIAKRAEEYLYEMLRSKDEDARPDCWSFNMAISAWSRSGDWELAEKAEALVTALEKYHAECGYSSKTEPNTNTWNCLIACYSRSQLIDKARRSHAVLEKMKDLSRNHGRTNQRPDAVTYNSVMSSYAKSKEKDAPQKVEALLREMYAAYEESGYKWLKPSSRSFNTCFDAWAKSKQPEAADRIMDWIQRMQDSFDKGTSPVAPNKWTYNAYLEALSKVRRPEIGIEAEKVLETMEAKVQLGQFHLKPDVLTFTNVIHCIALSGAEDAFERAYAILLRMEDLHASGYGDVRPNTYTYNCVINAVAKSKLHGKSKIAVKMLKRMKHVSLRPLTITYNNILNACAFSDPREENRQEVLDMAMMMLKEAQETCGANFITYGTILRVIGTFEDDPSSRWRLARDTFRSCCAAGQLNKLVMNQVKFAVSPSQYSLLEQEATDSRTGELRKDFTRNSRRKPAKKSAHLSL